MSVQVVNLYKRSYDVYIGRPGKGQKGTFGNPVAIGRKCPVCDDTHHSGASTLPCYSKALNDKLENDPAFVLEFMKLVQQAHKASQRNEKLVLGCFCKDRWENGACHGDILAEKIKECVKLIDQ